MAAALTAAGGFSIVRGMMITVSRRAAPLLVAALLAVTPAAFSHWLRGVQ
jgi:hypothetical protein